jgi:hypothetical protein
MMPSNKPHKKSVICLADFRAKQKLRGLLESYSLSLPAPSKRYENIIFLYDEDLATSGRELLFAQLNERARQFGQALVVTDVGYGRSGLYVNLDEIGATEYDPDYEALIEGWNLSH